MSTHVGDPCALIWPSSANAPSAHPTAAPTKHPSPRANSSAPQSIRVSTGKSAHANQTHRDPPRPIRCAAESSNAGSWPETTTASAAQAPPPDAAAPATDQTPCGDADQPEPPTYCRDWTRSLQLVELQSGRTFPFLFRDLLHRLREGPVMAFRVSHDIRAVAIKLIGRLHHNIRPGLACPREMLIDAFVDTYMHTLCVLSVERGGAASPIFPL